MVGGLEEGRIFGILRSDHLVTSRQLGLHSWAEIALNAAVRTVQLLRKERV